MTRIAGALLFGMDARPDSWLYGAKLLTLACLAVWYGVSSSEGDYAVVLLALGYLSLVTIYHLVSGAALRRALLVATLVLAAASAAATTRLFALLVPLCAAELVGELTPNRWVPVAPALLAAPAVGAELLPGYLLCAALGLLLYTAVSVAGDRLERLQREVDALRVSADRTERRSVAEAAYESQARYLALLEEQGRLAQEVHDRVGHAIAGSVIQLEAASALLGEQSSGPAALVRTSIANLRDGMESIRAALRERAPRAEELGFNRLKELVERFSAASGIASRVSVEGDLARIGPAHWRAIIDNAREILTNTMKHSAARSVAVSLRALQRLVRFEVRDDGRGAYSIVPGFGLRGLEERAHEIGAKVIFDGTRGFSVVMLIPIGGAAHGD